MDKLTFSPVPPSLSPALNNLYQSLDFNDRRIFVRVFRFLWNYLLPLRHLTGHSSVLYNYWAVDMLRVRAGLTPVLFASLTYLYYLTDKNTKIITSEQFFNGVVPANFAYISKSQILKFLCRRGYITRSNRNPQDPYYQRSYRRQYVFISLTPSSIALIEGIEKDLYYILVRSSERFNID